MYFALIDDDYIRDHIPLVWSQKIQSLIWKFENCLQEEVAAVEMMGLSKDTNTFSSIYRQPQPRQCIGLRRWSKECEEEKVPASRSFQIQTTKNGFNSGRTYYLQAESAEICQEIVRNLSKYVVASRKRADKASRYRRGQKVLLAFYESAPFQLMSSLLIILVSIFPFYLVWLSGQPV